MNHHLPRNGGLYLLSELLSTELNDDYVLVLRMVGGVHRVYRGHNIMAELKIPDEGIDIYVAQQKVCGDFKLRLSNLLEYNQDIIKVFETISLNMIKHFTNQADAVVIPWSGGKDSTAVSS